MTCPDKCDPIFPLVRGPWLYRGHMWRTSPAPSCPGYHPFSADRRDTLIKRCFPFTGLTDLEHFFFLLQACNSGVDPKGASCQPQGDRGCSRLPAAMQRRQPEGRGYGMPQASQQSMTYKLCIRYSRLIAGAQKQQGNTNGKNICYLKYCKLQIFMSK